MKLLVDMREVRMSLPVMILLIAFTCAGSWSSFEAASYGGSPYPSDGSSPYPTGGNSPYPTGVSSACPTGGITLDIFFNTLSPYGDWFWMDNYGWCWTPLNAPPHWRPYTTGHWIYTTDYGWTWVSDYEWGWAPFHYGRWFFDPRYGWVWVSGVHMVSGLCGLAIWKWLHRLGSVAARS